MLLNAKRYREKCDACKGERFILPEGRAGLGCRYSRSGSQRHKSAGLKAFYSSNESISFDAGRTGGGRKKLEDAGLDQITIMDSGWYHAAKSGVEYTKS